MEGAEGLRTLILYGILRHCPSLLIFKYSAF